MRARIVSPLAETAAGADAEAVLRACIHCGMCNAVCPTFQLTGDELDGPRGRIYLMKSALEGEPVGRETQLHLDRCLGCRACETVCPSGVEYHRLLDIGRPFVDARAPRRPRRERAMRWLIRTVTPQPGRFAVAARLGRIFAPLLPASLRGKIPARLQSPSSNPLPVHGERSGEGARRNAASERSAIGVSDASLGASAETPSPNLSHAAGEGYSETTWTDREAAERRRFISLDGCVQSVAAPQFNAAAARVFARVGAELAPAPAAGCCGAIDFHLGDPEAARRLARRNIDAWLAEVDAGAEGLAITASGCAAHIRDYPHLFAEDPAWRDKARAVAAMVRDPIQILEQAPPTARRAPAEPRIAVHEPCTLRNGLKLPGRIEHLLAALGYQPQPVRDPHLCCGSAGSYALLQPKFAGALRDNKLAALTEHAPAAIYTANIGCWMHLAETSPVPVRHWLEAVDDVT